MARVHRDAEATARSVANRPAIRQGSVAASSSTATSSAVRHLSQSVAMSITASTPRRIHAVGPKALGTAAGAADATAPPTSSLGTSARVQQATSNHCIATTPWRMHQSTLQRPCSNRRPSIPLRRLMIRATTQTSDNNPRAMPQA